MKKKNWVLVILVLALGAAVYLNWQLAPQIVTSDESEAVSSRSDENLGEATFVDASQDSSVAETEAVSAGNDYFTQARLSRDTTHNDAIKELEEIINDADIGESEKAQAVEKAAELTENAERQTNLENIIKAKGFAEALVTIGEQETTVVVKTSGLTANDAAIIKDIVVGQLGISSSCVRIIETE